MMPTPFKFWLPEELMSRIVRVSVAPFPPAETHEAIIQLGRVVEIVGGKMLEEEHRRHYHGD